MTAKRAFPRDIKLTAIAIAYSNPDNAMVADTIIPRSPVGLEDFRWWSYPKGTAFTVPETRLSDKGRAARVELSASQNSSSTEDHAIEIPVTNKDIEQAPAGIDPRGAATEYATKLLLLRREIRVATLLQDPANYGAANKFDVATGGGTHHWDDPNADPLVDIRNFLKGMMMPGNYLAMGLPAWLALSSHPKVVSACLGNPGTSGFAPKAKICEQLEILDILVGSSLVNASAPTPDNDNVTLTRVWGANCVAFYKDSTAGFQNKAPTFCLTAQVGTRLAGVTEVPPGKMGLDGGIEVIAGEKVKELIIAPDCGFLISNVLG